MSWLVTSSGKSWKEAGRSIEEGKVLIMESVQKWLGRQEAVGGDAQPLCVGGSSLDTKVAGGARHPLHDGRLCAVEGRGGFSLAKPVVIVACTGL